MTSYVTPKKNTAFVMYVSLTSRASRPQQQANPTLAAGDVKVSIDDGALANLTTLPSVSPAGSVWVKISLSAAEMNGDNIKVQFIDAAGAEWDDLSILIQTTTQQIDDLATVAGVWAAATRTLTSFDTLVADIAASINALLSQIIPQDIPPLSSDIELRRGDSWARAITVGSVAGYVSLDWIIKPNTDNPDNRALWWTRKNASGSGDGLLYLNGEAASTAAQGSITVSDAATGSLVLNAYSVATAQLAPGEYLYEVQMITVAGQTASTVASGKFTILADVARATS